MGRRLVEPGVDAAASGVGRAVAGGSDGPSRRPRVPTAFVDGLRPARAATTCRPRAWDSPARPSFPPAGAEAVSGGTADRGDALSGVSAVTVPTAGAVREVHHAVPSSEVHPWSVRGSALVLQVVPARRGASGANGEEAQRGRGTRSPATNDRVPPGLRHPRRPGRSAGTWTVDSRLADQSESNCGWEGCRGGPLGFPAHPAVFYCTAQPAAWLPMHLLYLDDAGSVGNVREQYLVLGGVSVFEAQSSWVTQELDRLAQNIDPGKPPRRRVSRLGDVRPPQPAVEGPDSGGGARHD